MNKVDMKKANFVARQRKVAKIQPSFMIVYAGLILISVSLLLSMWVTHF